MEDEAKQLSNSQENKTKSSERKANTSSELKFPNLTQYDSQNGNMGTETNHQMTRKEYRNVSEYARDVQCWLWQYRMMNAMGFIQSQMLANMHSNVRLQYSGISGSSNTIPQVFNQNHVNEGRVGQAPVSSPTGGVHYRIPLLWRRIVAEILDFILLFYLKVIVTVGILRQMGYMNDDLLEMDVQFGFLSDLNEMDYDKMFSLTSELIALEVINRLCITLVETMCLKQGYAGAIGGATPGKKIMRLRVISFDEIRETRNRCVMVSGARDAGFANALVRSVIKNFSMAFFFPASFTVFFFRYNRAAYDVLSQTVVVEVEPGQQ